MGRDGRLWHRQAMRHASGTGIVSRFQARVSLCSPGEAATAEVLLAFLRDRESLVGNCLRRQEVVPPLRIVVGIVRPDHPVHDVAPARLERAGVAPADRPARFRLFVLAAKVPPLIVGVLALGSVLLSLRRYFSQVVGRRIVALRRHLRAPPSFEAEIHVIKRGLKIRRVLRDRHAVVPRREPSLGKAYLQTTPCFFTSSTTGFQASASQISPEASRLTHCP